MVIVSLRAMEEQPPLAYTPDGRSCSEMNILDLSTDPQTCTKANLALGCGCVVLSVAAAASNKFPTNTYYVSRLRFKRN